ncbi:MAG: translation initiation factor IF-3 [Deltaproteobacteria bacterium]|nr:MAG: translation initiation factor IF-3 [Deltaproteobacteria bacterium]
MDRRFSRRKDSEPRVNNRIVAREVRVISPEGEQLGIMSTSEALRIAEEQGLDLVEVAPDSRPPVCRIMDYGKYKYTQKKKMQSAKRKAASQQLKEVKLRPKTEEHDYQVKIKHVHRFLQEGNKVKVTIRFRGREMAHRDIGMAMLNRIIEDAGELATVATAPVMEGRLLHMILSPSQKALKMKKEREEKRRAEEGAQAKKNEAGQEQQKDRQD